MIIHLEHGGTPFGINYTEVSFYQAGLGQRIEKLTEILHRSAHFQRTPHYPSVGLSTLLTGFHLDQVIRLRIHNGEPRGVRTYPHIRRIIFHTVDNGYKRIAPAGEISHTVLRKVRIAVLPQQGASVGSNLAGDYGRCASGKRSGASQRYNDSNQSE